MCSAPVARAKCALSPRSKYIVCAHIDALSAK